MIIASSNSRCVQLRLKKKTPHIFFLPAFFLAHQPADLCPGYHRHCDHLQHHFIRQMFSLQRGFSLIEGGMLRLEKAAFEKGAVTVCNSLCVFCGIWISVPLVMLILTRHNTAQCVHRTSLCPPPSPGKQTPRDAGTGQLLCFLSLDQYLPCHLYKLQT